MSVYDDGSEIEVTIEQDEQPKSGEWVDSEEVIADLTEEEAKAGEFLGAAIDIDDDEDDGSKWGSIDSPTVRPEDF